MRGIKTPKDRFAGQVDENVNALQQVLRWQLWAPEALARPGVGAHQRDDGVAQGAQLRSHSRAHRPVRSGYRYRAGLGVECAEPVGKAKVFDELLLAVSEDRFQGSGGDAGLHLVRDERALQVILKEVLVAPIRQGAEGGVDTDIREGPPRLVAAEVVAGNPFQAAGKAQY